MATKNDFKQAQERIFARPRWESRSDQELLRKTEDDGVYPSSLNIKAIRVDRIAPGNRPPRTYSEASLADLGQSLLVHGQIIPILVQYDSDEDVFLLIDGERRWRAAQKVGIQTLHAVILGRMSVAESYEQQVAAALQQNDWDPDERVQALEAYRMLKGLDSWAAVAEHLGVSDATLQALLCGPAGDLARRDGGATDIASEIGAAMRLLDHALSCLTQSPGDDASVMKALDDIAAQIAAHRQRMQQARSKAQADAKRQSSEGATKPVRRMPTWGER